MPVYCTNCGTQLADGSTFCTSCGKPLASAPPAGGAPPVATPAAASPGLTDNAAGAIAYLTIIPAIIFLLIEPYNRKRFVRFHAFQCIFLCVAYFVVRMIFWFAPLGFFGLLLLPVRLLLGLLFFIVWLIAIIKASQGQMFKLPLIGDMAEQQASSGAVA